MKHSTISFGTVGLVAATLLFLITVSTASAQTGPQIRPGTVDVDNIRSERPLDAPKELPRPTLFESRQQDVRKDSTEARELKENTQRSSSDKPASFLDKARDVLKEKRQINTSDGSDQAKERASKFMEKKKERISDFFKKITRKMDAAVARLLKLSERIESRIVKFEEREIDMTEARRLLTIAQDSIKSAEESVKTAIENARTALETDVSRDAFGSVVSELAKAKESLRDAHKSLIQVVRTMKSSLPDKDGNTDNAETNDTN